LEEKAKEATRNRQLAEKEMELAEKLLEAAKKIDANVTEAEKSLAEATAAMRTKDYKLALEKATESRERARRVYQERVKGIIDSSAILLELTKRIGKEVSEGEASLAKAKELLEKEDFEGATEHAKKSWKKSEKILHEHLSEAFSKTQSIILTAKNIGKDTSGVEDLLSRARSAVESNDYEMALSYTKECLDSVGSELKEQGTSDLEVVRALMKMAEEMGADSSKIRTPLERAQSDIEKEEYDKAFNSLKQARAEAEKTLQKAVERRITDFEGSIKEAENIGADASSAKAFLKDAGKALKDGNYEEAANLLKKSEKELENAQFQRVLLTISESRGKFITARSIGADLSTAMSLLNEAREALRKGSYRQALEFARKGDEEVERIIKEFQAVENEIRSMQRIFSEAEDTGVDTSSARRLLERARAALQSKDFGTVLESIKRSKEEMVKAEYERAMEVMEQAEFMVSLGEKIGIEVSEGNKILEECILATKEKEYRKAIYMAIDCKETVERSLSTHLTRTLEELKESSKLLGGEATDIRGLLGKAEGAVSAKDYEGAHSFLEEARKATESKTKERAIEFFEALKASVKLGKELECDMSSLEAKLKEASTAMDASKYPEVIKLKEDSMKEIGASADNIFSLVKAEVVEAKRLGIDITQMRDLLKKAKIAISTEDYLEAFKMMTECSSRANEVLRVHQSTYNLISSAAALVAEAKKRDVDVSKVIEMLLEAKKAFEKYDYGRAIDLANRSKAETEKLMILYTAAQRIISSRENLDIASSLGIDTGGFQETLNRAKDAMKNKKYEDALELSERCEKGVTGLIRDKLSSILSANQSLISEGKEAGMDFSVLEEKVRKATDLMAEARWKEAIELAVSVRNELETMRKKSEEASIALKKAQDILSELEALNVEATNALKLFERANRLFKNWSYDEAIDLANKCTEEAEKERHESISAAIASFEKAVVKAKEDGINTRSAEELLGQAKELFRMRNYQQALALAMQSESEIEKVGLQQEMASKAMMTVERRLKSFEIPLPDVEKLIGEGRKSFEEGDYVKALDIAIRSGDELNRKREQYEEALEAKASADRITKLARLIGADASKLEKMFEEGANALQGGELEFSRNAFQQCLEWGMGVCKSHLTNLLSKSKERMEVCRKLDIDTDSINQKISEAKAQLDEENFEKAYELLKDASNSAQKALNDRVSQALSHSEEAVSHAKRIGADVSESEELLKEGRQALAEQQYEKAFRLAGRSVEVVESTRMLEKRFIELTYQAESMIRSAKKFGIDVREAERVLREALSTKKEDRGKSMALAEESCELVKAAVEAFTPAMDASLDIEKVILNEWCEATLTLSNTGKALAKDVKVHILGDAEVQGLRDIIAIRARASEKIPIKIKMTASGAIPLAIQITSHRVFDDKEYVQERIAHIEVPELVEKAEEPEKLVAEQETRCPICRSIIKKGLTIAKCSCGKVFHELCASRAQRCPACSLPLRGEKKKLASKPG